MAELSEKRREEIKAIKKRLNDAYKVYMANGGGGVNSLLSALNAKYEFELNYDTLRKTLSEAGTTLDFFCVLALCRFWKLDIAYILSPAGNRAAPMPAADAQLDSGKYIVLNDPDYLGTYYGYLLSNKPGDPRLHKMRLSVEDGPNGFTASLTIESEVEHVDRHREPLIKKLHGTPILSTFNNNIAILMTDEVGNLVFLYVDYMQCLGKTVYYKKGVAVTSASSSSREPLMQSFVLFEKSVSKEKLPYIPGLLLPTQPDFPITQESMLRLREEQPLIEEFFRTFSYLLEPHAEMTYIINEVVLLNEKSTMSKEDRLKAIMLLKEKALAANRFFFTHNGDYAAFSKSFLQRADPLPTPDRE